jgi:hypothetical protein
MIKGPLSAGGEAAMNMNVIYVGLDVDDTQHHGSALNKHTGEVINFQCGPTLAGLLKQLAKLDQAFPIALSASVMKPPISAAPYGETWLNTVITGQTDLRSLRSEAEYSIEIMIALTVAGISTMRSGLPVTR